MLELLSFLIRHSWRFSWVTHWVTPQHIRGRYNINRTHLRILHECFEGHSVILNYFRAAGAGIPVVMQTLWVNYLHCDKFSWSRNKTAIKMWNNRINTKIWLYFANFGHLRLLLMAFEDFLLLIDCDKRYFLIFFDLLWSILIILIDFDNFWSLLMVNYQCQLSASFEKNPCP